MNNPVLSAEQDQTGKNNSPVTFPLSEFYASAHCQPAAAFNKNPPLHSF
jgi:hypothetical protein